MSERAHGEIRARTRTLGTWELLLLAGGLQNVAFEGSSPADAVSRFKTMQEKVVAELARRGIAVAPNPDLVAVARYRGEASNLEQRERGER